MLTAGRKTVRKPCLLLDTHFPKNTHVVEDLYIEENLDDQSIDNISNPFISFFTLADSHLPRLPCS